MARKRTLKVYRGTVYGRPEWAKAAGLERDPRQWNAVVAAYSGQQARALLGMTHGDWRHSGGITGNAEAVEIAMSAPGQVFARPLTQYGVDHIKLGRRPGSRTLVVDAESTLEAGDLFLAEEERAKQQRKDEEAEWQRRRIEEAERREQTDRVIAETLERVRPALEALGVNPQTVSAGVGASGRGRGVLLPAETIERIVKLALIGDEIENG